MICQLLDELQPKQSGSYADQITFVEDRPGHDKRYAIDSSKIQNEIGWTPKEDFESGFKKTIKWYLENTQWGKNIINEGYRLERLGLNS